MCKNQTTNISVSKFIATKLLKAGVKHVCISPGSRNTPLTVAFTNNKKFKCYSLIDERSSAYFALGISKTLNEPVAILTTSGTGAANLLPAAIESYLNQSTLFLLTADRPKKLINTGASQTINQKDLFKNYTKAMIDIEISSKSILEKLKKLNDLIDSQNDISGPIHLNVRFDEPLIDNDVNLEIKNEKQKGSYSNYKPIKLPKFKKPLIICGPLKNNIEISKIVKLSKKLNAPIIADCLSNIRYNNSNSKNIFTYYDFYIKNLKNNPDIILRFGDKPISKNLNEFIYKNSKITFLIDPNAGFNDDCKNNIISDYNGLDKIQSNSHQELLNEFKNNDKKVSKIIDKYITGSKSQAEVVKQILNNTKKNDNCFIGSSTMIRTFDQFMDTSSKSLKLLSNHITRGIDGTVSASLGMASTNNKTNNYLFIGDVSFFYDLNAFHILNQKKINLNIIVINNNGGQIFSRLPYSNLNLRKFDTFWITPIEAKIKNIAKLYNMIYLKASTSNLMKKIANINLSKGINLIEIKIKNNDDINFIKKIENKINN